MIDAIKKAVCNLLLLSLCSIPTVRAATSEPRNPAKATLKTSALVSKSEINADCLIKPDCDQLLKQELASIQLGYIPEPLGELIIDRQALAEKLGNFASRIELPNKVVIKRQGAFLKGAEIIEKIKEICNPNAEENVQIDTSRIPTNVVLPGNLKSWQLNTNSDNRLGMRLFSLTAETDGGSFRQLIQVSVVKRIEAAALNRLAKPGETISKSMIGKKIVELKSEQANLPVTYEEALGKCLGRYKSPGTVLRSSDLSSGENNICNHKTEGNKRQRPRRKSFQRNNRENWAVKPGDNVDFRFENGTLELSFPARAMEGGEIGDRINLINLRNQKKVQGVITDKGRVEYAKN